MKPRQYGPCGLYCGACGARDCNGCRSGFTDENVKACTFRRCAGEKRIDACRHCPDYPCAPLSAFMTDKWPHHWTMKPNLEFIGAHGIPAWLAAQEKEWSCPACGAPTHWYQKNCPCGKRLESWELPE